MFQLDRHIEILLLDNDCVIIPGLGGFIAHHVSAHYDEETKTFLPPLRTLGFNRQLQINDSLLAQSYIETYDISYPEAIRRIESEVNELTQRLRSEGKCELNGIGILFNDEDGKILFEPNEAGILTPQYYGLNLVDIDPLIATHTVSEKKRPSATPILTMPEQQPQDEDEEEEYEERTITLRVSTLKYALATAAAVVFLIVFALPLGQGDRPDVIQSRIDTSILNNLIKKDSVVPKAQVLRNDSTIQNTAAIQESRSDSDNQQHPALQKTPIAKKTTDYSLVLASRVSETNARNFVKILKRQGITARIINRKNGCQVVTGNYRNQKEAINALRSYRNGCEIFAEAWITSVGG